MARTLTYAGKNLTDFSVWWDNSRIFNKPPKLYQSFDIPNRNGTLLSSLNKFENIQIEYDCFIKDNFKDNYNDLIDFLTSFNTYQRLENSEEPETYRMGVFRAEVSTETGQFLKDGRFTLVFDCKPQNFYKSGDELQEIAVSLQGNQWSDTSDNIDGIDLTYTGNGYYILSGTKYTTTIATRLVNIPIPSAGTWDISLRVIRPDQYLGRTTSVFVNNRRIYLDQSSTVNLQVVTAEASSVSFRIEIDGGGTINAEMMASLTQRIQRTFLINPSRKASRPLFVYETVGTRATIVVAGDTSITYSPPSGATDSDGTLYIDCELMDCYLLKSNGQTVNYNPFVNFTNDFPELEEGQNIVYVTNGTAYVAPRWWRL